MSIQSQELLPCPFCGGEAEIERLGDRRQSTIYSCTECGCHLETSEEWGHGARWNARYIDHEREVAGMKATIQAERVKSRLMGIEDGARAYGDESLTRENAALHEAIEKFWTSQAGGHACGCDEWPECTHTLNAHDLRMAGMGAESPLKNTAIILNQSGASSIDGLRFALHEARNFIASVACEEGLTIDAMLELIDKALGTGSAAIKATEEQA